MQVRSKKAKGAAFEKLCLEEIKKLDPKSYRVFGSGAGLQKGDLYCPNLNWIIEAKNHRQINLKGWIGQLERQGNDYNKSILLFKSPKSADINPDIYAVVSLYHLSQIVSAEAQILPLGAKPDRQLEYDIANLKLLCSKVLKSLHKQ